jgi:hypothetical protein
MRESLSEADRYRSGHGPGANPSRSPLRRSGQVDDYYPLIAQAVSRLERNTADKRQTIYDRARAAMVTQLRNLTPALSESDINREQMALDGAVRKVEAESLRRTRIPLRSSIGQPNQPRGRIHETGDLQETSNVDASDDLPFAKKLVTDTPDLSAELEILQHEIRDRRGWLTIFHAPKLVSLTLMGLLVFSAAASGAY